MSSEIATTAGIPARRRLGRLSPSEALAKLSAVDRELISALSAQRVLTASQLERLFAPIPPRTLRYRTARLTRLGLIGRTRPYRERGSAPFHYWPSRAGDAYARGESLPRGGERYEPNPLFLAHAAGLSELYVGLASGEARGLRLRAFRREGEAREPFKVLGTLRAIAPDARLDLCDADGGEPAAHLELDRGTMSSPRLKSKADGYAAYAAEDAWRTHHPFCPCLLFLTTTEARARRFMKTLGGLLRRGPRGDNLGWFTAAACAVADEPRRALAEPCWHDLTGRSALTLADCLRAARAPWDAARARDQAARRAREQRLNQLRSDPDVLRRHLRENSGRGLTYRLGRFGRDGHVAFDLLIEASAPLCRIERETLIAFASYAGDELLSFDGRAAATPAAEQQKQVDDLVELYRARQETLVGDFLEQVGPLPSLRAAREKLSTGALLDLRTLAALPECVRVESESRSAQEERRERYIRYRERAAREDAGIFGRLTHQTEVLAAQTDKRVLRYCGDCGETIYPETVGDVNEPRPPEECAFCGSRRLLTLNDAAKTYPERFAL